MAYQLVPEAEEDLTAIWSYVAADSGNEEIADRVIDSVSRRFDFLSNTHWVDALEMRLCQV
jgi:plasmid stabilization system protein ParE